MHLKSLGEGGAKAEVKLVCICMHAFLVSVPCHLRALFHTFLK